MGIVRLGNGYMMSIGKVVNKERDTCRAVNVNVWDNSDDSDRVQDNRRDRDGEDE